MTRISECNYHLVWGLKVMDMVRHLRVAPSQSIDGTSTVSHFDTRLRDGQ